MHPPLKIPFSFSGSFGELRATHFHSGVDFKTNGKSGYRIYASENGYVARIVVSPIGYGRAVYVKHPNGLMTVYAHLRNFSPKIEKYVRDMQYKKESWALNIGIKKGVLSVKRGEILGFSGNAGSSGGPHLHYEVRDANSQEPINPLLFFKAKDNMRPKIQALYIYNMNKGNDMFSASVKSKTVERQGNRFCLKNTKELHLNGKVGFGLKVKDFINGSWNSCGVYSLSMFVNGAEKYRYVADRFSFSNTVCVNVVKDYSLYMEKRVKVYKTWLPGEVEFNGIKHCEDDGLVNVLRDSVYNVRFEVRDVAGNKSVLKVKVRGGAAEVENGAKEGVKYSADKYNKIKQGGLSVVLKPNSLFGDVCFSSSVDTIKDKGFVGNLVYNIGGDYIPLRKKAGFSVVIDTSLLAKAYIVNALNGDKFSAVSTQKSSDSLYCKTRNLGKYAVCIDTVSPKLRPLGKYRLKRFAHKGRMFFRVEDKESGLQKYEARVNGKWVMTSYDAKRNLLVVVFDKKRIKTGSKCKFVLTVSDNCGNESSYKTSIYL